MKKKGGGGGGREKEMSQGKTCIIVYALKVLPNPERGEKERNSGRMREDNIYILFML